MIHYVVENNKFQEDGHERLVEAIRLLPNTRYSLVKVIPFSHELENIGGDPLPDKSARVFVFGSTTLMRIAKERGWTPGAFTENLDISSLFHRYGALCANIDGRFMRLQDALTVCQTDGIQFIRPLGDTKTFAGQTFNASKLEEWLDRLAILTPEDNPEVSADTEVLVASPKDLLEEVRFWVVGKHIVTGSHYRKDGRPYRKEVKLGWGTQPEEFAKNVTRDPWDLSIYVLDVARVNGAVPYWAVLETNCLSGAGLYEANVESLVNGLHRYLQKC